jgi:F-type H+-transporting ATPase subunit b
MIATTNNFILPNATFIPEAITFFILLYLLAKYVLPPIKARMDERQAQIAQSLEVIQQAKAAEEETKARVEAMLEEARRQARAQIDQATRLGEEIREELRQRGQEEYQRSLSRAQVEIERATQRASDELRRHLAELVVAASEQVVGRELDPERHRALIDAAIGEVETSA